MACARYGINECKPYWIFVFENQGDAPHVHWAVHIPEILKEEFQKKVHKWLEKKQSYAQPTSIKIDEINAYTDKTLANYLVKGVVKTSVEYFHLQHRAEYQGKIWGRRSMVSHSISRTARRRASFIPGVHRHQWPIRHPDMAAKYQKPYDWNMDMLTPKVAAWKRKKRIWIHQKSNYNQMLQS